MYSNEFNEKVSLINDTIKFGRTKTIPFLSNDSGWCIADAGYTYKEAFYSYEIMEKAVREYHERYNFDVYNNTPGTLTSLPFTDALGGGNFRLDEKTDHYYALDEMKMDPEDYETYMKDPQAVERLIFSRKYPDVTNEGMLKAVGEFLKKQEFSGKINQIYAEEFSRPMMKTTAATVTSPIESLFNAKRGMKGLAIDMRRRPEAVKAFCDKLWNESGRQNVERIINTEPTNYVCHAFLAFLAHSFLSTKQFEDFYWSYSKETFDMLIKANKTAFCFVEAELSKISDFFSDLDNSGHNIVIHLEMDDITEMRKKLPGICLAGGMPQVLLNSATPDQCVDRTKYLADQMGRGFILSTDKILLYKNDCRRDNLLAVSNFIRSHSI